MKTSILFFVCVFICLFGVSIGTTLKTYADDLSDRANSVTKVSKMSKASNASNAKDTDTTNKTGTSSTNTETKAKKLASCTADGHGPYDLTYSKCMQLGADQAHTNCVLKSKDAKVELVFATQKIKKTAVCYAKVKAGSEDCEPAQCYVGNDTAQH